ncbi:adenine-specific DNA-methyltransferase [Methylobacterium fujisawaense]|uniref:site-specific DNA-methyltransferase (adenine-specific) n=1 Tax=Methylobacterium fujisawaense TaxID=107400 RepID=A0ABR6D5Z9_9HYPH|nr:site-specific DNA-methyltransferase [Methylobacterium fujisawaense]MBA9061519.1 adenine-specific DNA-methyltransferase [Methylobacterium fujisawaense]
MTRKQKLELTWVGKENRPRLEPRILLDDMEKSYHAKHRVSDDDIFDNRLIFGDNLLALRALEQEFAGKVKCVFIDPPYNTGSAFDHYDDGLEHSIWLGLMRDRLEIIRRLLSDDGSLWVTLDDNEAHYFKVMCDEVFGRKCFVADVIWKSSDNSNNDAKQFSLDHNHVLVYSKNENWLTIKTRGSDEKYKHFKNPDNDPRGPWFDGNPLGSPAYRENLIFDLISPQGHKIKPPTNGWRWSKETLQEKIATGEIRFTADGKGIRRRTYLREQGGLPPSTLWIDLEETGHNRQAKFEQKRLFPDWEKSEWFGTPKPERLLKRVLEIATVDGDLVLDSFAGSGTTGAVAHKMGRRWIMVELGEHCHTHIIPRLRQVIDGEDKGGVTEATGWQGGGGFRYFKLAPSLLEKDKWGREVISKTYNAEMLAEALCKIESFTYAPSDSVYWQHGTSTERDFIYVTTQILSPEQLDVLSEEVGEGRTLLVLCAAFRGNTSAWPNLTVKKIPNHIRERCEWGHDDYSLNVENLPKAPPATKAIDKATPRSASQPGLFDLAVDDQ